MRKFLALAVVGASLAFTATAALADGTFLPRTPDNNVPMVLQPSNPDQGTTAGDNDQNDLVNPYVQPHETTR